MNKMKKIISFVLAFALVFTGISIPSIADAASTSVKVTKSITYQYKSYGVGSSWSTNRYMVNFANNSTYKPLAYSLYPDEHGPLSGTFKCTALNGSNRIGKILYWSDKRFSGKDSYFSKYHKNYNAGKQWIIIHLAVGKANGASWKTHVNSYTQKVVENLYNYCMTKGAIPSAEFKIIRSGDSLADTDEDSSFSVKAVGIAGDNMSKTIRDAAKIDSNLKVSKLYRLKCDNKKQKLSVTMPSSAKMVILKKIDNHYEYDKTIGYGKTSTVGDCYFQIVSKSSTQKTSSKIKFTAKEYTNSLQCYKLTSVRSSKPELATLVKNPKTVTLLMTMNW